MQRTQISLGDEERRLLDDASAHTGRSISSLIREAVRVVYGPRRSIEDDLAAIGRAHGSWTGPDRDGAAWVDELRAGTRLDDRG